MQSRMPAVGTVRGLKTRHHGESRWKLIGIAIPLPSPPPPQRRPSRGQRTPGVRGAGRGGESGVARCWNITMKEMGLMTEAEGDY